MSECLLVGIFSQRSQLKFLFIEILTLAEYAFFDTGYNSTRLYR